MAKENFLKENNAQHFWHPMAHPSEMKNNPPLIIRKASGLEVEDIDASGLTNPGLLFDYFSDLGTYSCGNNILHVEAYDGTGWINVSSLQLQATGWNM